MTRNERALKILSLTANLDFKLADPIQEVERELEATEREAADAMREQIIKHLREGIGIALRRLPLTEAAERIKEKHDA